MIYVFHKRIRTVMSKLQDFTTRLFTVAKQTRQHMFGHVHI
jgi:hypothetical protein